MISDDPFAPYYKFKGKFVNPYLKESKRTLWDIALWQLGYYNDPVFPTIPPADFSYPNPKTKLKESEPVVSWINHCTFLVEIDGVNFLTDPIWSNRCSPVSFFGPKRIHEPPCGIDELPEIHYVLISHNHYDHLDEPTVRKLHDRFPNITWIIPLGLKSWFAKRGITKTCELAWWEDADFDLDDKLSMTITAVPTQHFSGRGIFDTDKTLWVGYVVDFVRVKKSNKKLYFVGDTGYNEKSFKQIGSVFGGMDLSLIPIGTYIPHKFMDPVHIDPIKATAIHMDVKSKLSIGMHWKTFKLSGEPLIRPPYDLFLTMEENNLNPLDFRILDPGQKINW